MNAKYQIFARYDCDNDVTMITTCGECGCRLPFDRWTTSANALLPSCEPCHAEIWAENKKFWDDIHKLL